MHRFFCAFRSIDKCGAGILIFRGNLDSASSVGVPISFSGSGVSIGDFTIFGYVSLGLSAFFCADDIGNKERNVKSGIKYIPIFMQFLS